ncbi:MAG: nucleotidyltransferase domain-containing protein [Mangrovibacterium sp.]
MKFGLSETTISQLCSVFENYPEIEEVIIYGSRAKGNYREGSDIDITLKGTSLTEQIRASVWLDIDELDTPYLFDISIFHLLKSDSLIDHINRAGKVLYRKED